MMIQRPAHHDCARTPEPEARTASPLVEMAIAVLSLLFYLQHTGAIEPSRAATNKRGAENTREIKEGLFGFAAQNGYLAVPR